MNGYVVGRAVSYRSRIWRRWTSRYPSPFANGRDVSVVSSRDAVLNPCLPRLLGLCLLVEPNDHSRLLQMIFAMLILS